MLPKQCKKVREARAALSFALGSLPVDSNYARRFGFTSFNGLRLLHAFQQFFKERFFHGIIWF